MLAGVAASMALCREARGADCAGAGKGVHPGYKAQCDALYLQAAALGPSFHVEDIVSRRALWSDAPPARFVRKHRRGAGRAHRDEALLPGDGEDGVVAARPARGRVDEEVDYVVGDPGRWGLGEHDVHVSRLEDLLQGVEGEPTQFAFDEVWPVLHDGLQLDVPVARLPAGHEVQHVGAVGRLPVFAALGAGQGDAEDAEEGQVGDLVPHAEQARVEVDLGREGRDGDERGVADDEERRDGLVEEARVHVGRLLEDDDVAAGALGC